MMRGDVYPGGTGRARAGTLFSARQPDRSTRTGAAAGDPGRRSQPGRFLEKQETVEALAVRERILVCVSSNPAAQYLIARGSRMAQGLKGEFYVLYVDSGCDTAPKNQRTLE